MKLADLARWTPVRFDFSDAAIGLLVLGGFIRPSTDQGA
jgi:hypothetical protein